MLALLSPAKKLDFSPAALESQEKVPAMTTPSLLKHTWELAAVAQACDTAEIKRLMALSDNLAQLNYELFQNFNRDSKKPNGAKQAVLAFNGDTYTGLNASTFKQADLEFAQEHLRILSGLYGTLRPLDALQPYRLEMGTRLVNPRGKNLYEFWGKQIALQLNLDLKKTQSDVVINLASQEYFSAVEQEALRARVVTCDFRELRDGKSKMISFFAKQGRGAMARYIVQKRLTQPEELKSFDRDGYCFEPSLSTEERLVFQRPDSRSA